MINISTIIKIMISTAFRIESAEDELPSTGPYISFVRKIYSRPKQEENDCVFGVNVTEYNNFSFTSKGRINFKIQVVYEVGPDSHFRKLTPKLEIGKLIFVAGLLDLSDDDLPFVEAKEIDLLENFINDHSSTNAQSLFSRTQKFKTSRTVSIKKEKSLDDTIEKALFSNQNQDDDKEELKNEGIEYNSEINQEKKGNKRKIELADLSIQRLKKARNLNKVTNNKEFDINNNEEPNQSIKGSNKRSGIAGNNKTTKVTTRSQKQDAEKLIEDVEYITDS